MIVLKDSQYNLVQYTLSVPVTYFTNVTGIAAFKVFTLIFVEIFMSFLSNHVCT